jgi:hypothetical protein
MCDAIWKFVKNERNKYLEQQTMNSPHNLQRLSGIKNMDKVKVQKIVILVWYFFLKFLEKIVAQ